MSTKELPVKTKRPKKAFSNITLLGVKALDLAVAHQTEIEIRLPDVCMRLSKDLGAMNVVIPGAIQARNEAMASTSAQNALIQRGCERVLEIREAVRTLVTVEETRDAYGVGRPIGPTHFANVRAALNQIVDRATTYPDEAALFSFVAADVDALKSLISDLEKADAKQDQKRARAPLSTKERNETANRILQTVVLIATAGRSAFTDQPKIRVKFNELMEGVRNAGGSKAKKSDAAPKGAAPKGAAPKGAAPDASAPGASDASGAAPSAVPESPASAAPGASPNG